MFQEAPGVSGALSEEDGLRVFAYGSLIWNPGFPYVERRKARLHGYNRRLCVWSHHYRGEPEKPGLVFGLDPGGECLGVVFRVEPKFRQPTIAYLRERELITNVYLETEVLAVLESGERVTAVAYVADVDHSQYAGRLSPQKTLEIVKHASGRNGPNAEYVLNTRAHLEQLEIDDPELDWLCARLRE